jgi:hypothetical protein
MVNCQGFALTTTEAPMIVVGAQRKPFLPRERSAVVVLSYTAAMISKFAQSADHFMVVRIVLASVIVVAGAFAHSFDMYWIGAALSKPITIIDGISLIVFAALCITNSANLWTFSTFSNYGIAAMFTLAMITQISAFVGVKFSEGFFNAAFRATFVWYTIHVGSSFQLSNVPRAFAALRGFVMPHYSIGTR